MLPSVSALPPRARLGRPHAASLLPRRHREQTRAFGFGWWAHRLSRDEQREARRRFQDQYQKHVEDIHRRRLWEQKMSSDETPHAFRRGGRYWQSKRCFAGDWSMGGKPIEGRPGRETEYGRRSPWGEFLFREDKAQSTWASPFDDIRSYVARRQSEILHEADFGAPAQPTAKSAKEDYVIDPITNRKVPKALLKSAAGKADKSAATADNSFRSYRSRFSEATVDKNADAKGALDSDLPLTHAERMAYRVAAGDDTGADAKVKAKDPRLSEYKTWEHPEEMAAEKDAPPNDDLAKYRPVQHDASGKKHSEVAASGPAQPEEMAQHKSFTWNEPDRQPKTDAAVASETESVVKVQGNEVKEDKKESGADATDESYASILRRINSLGDVDGIVASEACSPARAVEPAAGQPPKSDPEERGRLESAMARMNAEADAIDRLASVSLKAVKARVQSQAVETKAAVKTVETNADAKSDVPIPVSNETTYKIFAYDSDTRAMTVSAETTSTVHDAAKALTPAEALLRLSHPTKFFPFFRAQEALGFEIVAGDGNVLVFRKRRGAPLAPRVNPIDKTGVLAASAADVQADGSLESASRPAEASSAAATATIETATATATAGPSRPVFRSNIDVRRQEPVFSGRRINAEEEAKKVAPGIVKRMLVGATWVAGVSYVLGLASEQLAA